MCENADTREASVPAPRRIAMSNRCRPPQPSGDEGMCENADAREASVPAPWCIAISNRCHPPSFLSSRRCAKMLMLERLLCRSSAYRYVK
jgi:hypothetical protein